MPEGKPSSWSDLTTRVLSALVLAALALTALFGPPGTWAVLVVIVAVLAFWELAPLAEPGIAGWRRGLVAALPLLTVAIMVLPFAPEAALRLLIALALPLLAGMALVKTGHWVLASYGLILLLGAHFLVLAYALFGPVPVLLLVALIAVSDSAAYFVGRAVGGPKFWPRVSPKKTWSGTVAGWVGAALFAGLVVPWAVTAAGGQPVPALPAAAAGALLAFAGQIGDIVESALKRRVGIKDSSNLIPGHGGVLDRIDALIAASALGGLATLVQSAF